jgi:hypothetical protein
VPAPFRGLSFARLQARAKAASQARRGGLEEKDLIRDPGVNAWATEKGPTIAARYVAVTAEAVLSRGFRGLYPLGFLNPYNPWLGPRLVDRTPAKGLDLAETEAYRVGRLKFLTRRAR